MGEPARPAEGVVLWFNPARGYGFLRCPPRLSVFVHRSALLTPLEGMRPGARVAFELEEHARGYTATHVRVLAPPPDPYLAWLEARRREEGRADGPQRAKWEGVRRRGS